MDSTPRRRRRSLGPAVAAVWLLLAQVLVWVVAPSVAHAASFTVDSMTDTVDASPGDGICADPGGFCSLRAAIMELNALGGANHTINIDKAVGVPPEVPLTIPDTGTDSDGSGDLDIATDIQITVGPRPDAVIVPGPGFNDRAFNVLPAGSVRFVGVSVRGFTTAEDGGAVLNRGTTILDCGAGIDGNVGRDGGGIYNAGLLHFRGASSVSGNTGRLGGNIHAAPGSTTTLQGDNGGCRPNPAVQFGGGTAEQGGAIYVDDAHVQLEWDVGITDSTATVSGGAFEVVNDGEVRLANGTLVIDGTSAPVGSVGHLTGGAALNLFSDPGQSTFAAETWISGASVGPGSAHLHAEDSNLDLTNLQVSDSTGDVILTEGNSILASFGLQLRGGRPSETAITLGGNGSSFMRTSYIDGWGTAIRLADTARFDIMATTLIDDGTAIDAAVGTTANLDSSWLLRNSANCTRGADTLTSSAVTDTTCGTADGSLTDPTVASDTRDYDYQLAGQPPTAPLVGPDGNSPIRALVPAPCAWPGDIAGRARPGVDGSCEPGAIEFLGTAELPVADGSISGSVREDGTLEPLGGICVVSFGEDREEGPEAFDRTGADGSWLLSPLAAGQHLLAFYPCDAEGEFDEASDLIPESWQNHAIDPETDDPVSDADPITLTDVSGSAVAADVTGIDACMGTDADGGDETCGVAAETPPAPGSTTTTTIVDDVPPPTDPPITAGPMPAPIAFTG